MARNGGGPLSAIRLLGFRQTVNASQAPPRLSYSITSSARASSVGDT